MNNNIKINKWSENQYRLCNGLMTPYQLLRALALFRKDVLQNISNDLSLVLQLKIKTSTGEYRSISKCHLIKISDYIQLLGEFLLSLEIRSEAYCQIDVTHFILSYKIFDSTIIKNKINTMNKIKKLPSIPRRGRI